MTWVTSYHPHELQTPGSAPKNLFEMTVSLPFTCKDIAALRRLDPLSILRFPKCTCSIDEHLRPLVARYVHVLVRRTRAQIAARLPLEGTSWAGVRVKNGGDRIWTAELGHGRRTNEREGCYIRVCFIKYFSAKLRLLSSQSRSSTRSQ